jgi:hypothetical protein
LHDKRQSSAFILRRALDFPVFCCGMRFASETKIIN